MRRIPVADSIGKKYGKLTVIEDRGFACWAVRGE